MSDADRATGLQSMTGFGAAEGMMPGVTWRWELRTVNGKGLDVKFRMPTGTEVLEPQLRSALRALHRGTVSVNLRVEREAAEANLTVDPDALAAAVEAMSKVRVAVECDPPRADAILAMRGVLTSPQPEAGFSDEEAAALKTSFDSALAELMASRRAEGSRVVGVLLEKIETMIAGVGSIREKTKDARDQIAERLRAQLTDLLKDHVTEDRLAQEAAMLAIRADVSEELDRLSIHAKAFLELLHTEGAAGRRLEFLTQELMREASTLTAKLHSAELKSDGLDMKELIDALREQVLNIA